MSHLFMGYGYLGAKGRLGALSGISDDAESFLQEEGGGTIKPNMPGPPFGRESKVNLQGVTEAGAEKWMDEEDVKAGFEY